jgi:hypothetical protein
VRKVILDTVGTGVPRCHAADRAGIDRSTLWAWLARGRKDKKGKFFEFSNAVKKGEADAVAGSVARIRKAAIGGQLLERTTTTVTTRDKTGKPVTTTTTKERFSAGQWTADAWLLERGHSEHFAANNLETKELRKVLSELLKAERKGRNARQQ